MISAYDCLRICHTNVEDRKASGYCAELLVFLVGLRSYGWRTCMESNMQVTNYGTSNFRDHQNGAGLSDTPCHKYSMPRLSRINPIYLLLIIA